MFNISDCLSRSGEHSRTKLLQAVYDNDFAEVQKLINTAKKLKILEKMVNRSDKFGQTPLYHACWKGYSDIAYLLLDSNANIYRLDDNGPKPRVAQQHGRQQPDELLILQTMLNKGSTPAYMAALKGHEHILRKLLNHGYKIDHHSYEGWTLLHIAAQQGHYQIVKMLLEEYDGQTIINDSSNDYGDTPLIAAIEGTKGPEGVQIIKLLVKAGADKNKVGPENKTPLEKAQEVREIKAELIGNNRPMMQIQMYLYYNQILRYLQNVD